MKCTFCGSNVPDGSELCPECGMILSLDGAGDSDVAVPAYTPNVFGSEPIKAPELPEDYEESAFGSEFTAPEYNDESSAISEQEAAEASAEAAVEEPEEATASELPGQDAQEEPAQEVQKEEPQEVYEAPEYDGDLSEAEEEPTVVYEAPAYGDAEVDASFEEQESEYESFADTDTAEETEDETFAAYAECDDTEKATPVIVPVEDIPAEKPAAQKAEEEYENVEDDDDTYIKSGKKGKAASVVILCLLLVCLVVAGGYIATSYTDLVQGVIMIAGVILLVIAVLRHGSVDGISAAR